MIMVNERIEQRVLGALRLVDRATGGPLTRPLKVFSDSARLVRNLSGLYVVTQADGLEEHTGSFLVPPGNPALRSNTYSIEVHDPLMHYLPRLVSLQLPRDSNPDNAGSPDSLFQPRDVAMYPSSTARLSPNWSTIRASVSLGPDPQTARPVRGCLIRIVDAGQDTELAWGISDERGEALVIVPGVPVTKFADGENEGNGPPGEPPFGGGPPGHGGGDDASPVVVFTLAVRLEVSLQPLASWPVNPEQLEQNHEVHRRMSMDLELTTGRMERVAIHLT